MPECQHCGHHVTEQYARVFTPRGVDQPRCCPHCDLVRDGIEVRGSPTNGVAMPEHIDSEPPGGQA